MTTATQTNTREGKTGEGKTEAKRDIAYCFPFKEKRIGDVHFLLPFEVMMTRHVILDTACCSTADELHEVLKHQLGFPEYYGRNLDALWDCLTGEMALPTTVEWLGYSEARQRIGDYVDKVLETFRQAEHEVEGLKILVRGTSPRYDADKPTDHVT